MHFSQAMGFVQSSYTRLFDRAKTQVATVRRVEHSIWFGERHSRRSSTVENVSRESSLVELGLPHNATLCVA